MTDKNTTKTISGIFCDENGTHPRCVIFSTESGLIIDSEDRLHTGADYFYDDNFLIFPGFYDLHVHARQDISGTQCYKEDFASCGRAALAGGVCGYFDMPNNPVPPIDDVSFNAKHALTASSPAEVVLFAGAGPGIKPLSKKVPYKLFMGQSTGSLFYSKDMYVYDDLKHFSDFFSEHGGEPFFFSVHAESADVLAKSAKENTHAQRRPPEAEIKAISLLLTLLKRLPGIEINFCHISTEGGLQLVQTAKKNNLPVSAEAAFHHLLVSEESLAAGNDDLKTGFRINPPIRSENDRAAVFSGFAEGHIDFLVTDHAPHTPDEKKNGVSGIPSIELYGTLVCELLSRGISPQIIYRTSCANPGRIFNRFFKNSSCNSTANSSSDTYPKGYGAVIPGWAANFTVLAPHHPVTITREHIKSKCGWSPFLGVTFPGGVHAVFTRGRMHE